MACTPVVPTIVILKMVLESVTCESQAAAVNRKYVLMKNDITALEVVTCLWQDDAV